MQRRSISCGSKHLLSLNCLTSPAERIARLSEKETTTRDKLMPSITYLQKLGPEHLQQIFESSRWLFDEDKEMAFEVGTL